MNHAADTAMFWVGALFVFTPVVFFGIVIGVWWCQQKRRRADVAEETAALENSPQRAQREEERAAENSV